MIDFVLHKTHCCRFLGLRNLTIWFFLIFITSKTVTDLNTQKSEYLIYCCLTLTLAGYIVFQVSSGYNENIQVKWKWMVYKLLLKSFRTVHILDLALFKKNSWICLSLLSNFVSSNFYTRLLW
ncbi:hypothetical protein L2E82_39628 [Cichorium intybus]|uniref:Uncharacterized protein n=1 Tax=Cichorium intybus TaxID=13427 RepID=A0ACB9AJP9_CICIN|nr:hypothetical protein L2E82_39628 [Cichorium intybus]